MRTAFALLVVFIPAIVVGDEHGAGITLNSPTELKWQAGPPSLPKGGKLE